MGRQLKPGQLQTGSFYNISSSFALTASYALNAGGGSGAGFPYSGSAVITGSLLVTSGITGSLLGTASFATTASYVTSLGSSNYSQSFSNQSTWTITHNLGTRLVIIQTYDSNYNEMIPQQIDLTDTNNATITFPTLESGFAVASVGGTLASGNTYITNTIDTSSFAKTTTANTFTGAQKIISSISSVSPLWISGSTIDDGVGAFRADATEPDIFLNDTDGGYATVTFANAGDGKVAFGRDANDDFYITRATESVWWDDTFVISRSTGMLSLGYGLNITGSSRGNVESLSILSNTASLDLSLSNFFTLQLVPGTNTYINPSSIKSGVTTTLLVSTTGSATVSFPSIVKQPSGSSYTPTATTAKDILTFISYDASTLYVANVKNLI